MKRLLFPLIVSAVSFSQAGPAALQSAISSLCQTTQSFLGITIMLLIILSLPFLAAGAFVYYIKKEDKALRPIARILLGIGVLLAGGAIFSIIIYVLTPVTIDLLVGVPGTSGNPCASSY